MTTLYIAAVCCIMLNIGSNCFVEIHSSNYKSVFHFVALYWWILLYIISLALQKIQLRFHPIHWNSVLIIVLICFIRDCSIRGATYFIANFGAVEAETIICNSAHNIAVPDAIVPIKASLAAFIQYSIEVSLPYDQIFFHLINISPIVFNYH